MRGALGEPDEPRVREELGASDESAVVDESRTARSARKQSRRLRSSPRFRHAPPETPPVPTVAATMPVLAVPAGQHDDGHRAGRTCSDSAETLTVPGPGDVTGEMSAATVVMEPVDTRTDAPQTPAADDAELRVARPGAGRGGDPGGLRAPPLEDPGAVPARWTNRLGRAN